MITLGWKSNRPDPLQTAKGTALKLPVFSQRPDVPEAQTYYELRETDTKHGSQSDAQKKSTQLRAKKVILQQLTTGSSG